MSLDFYVGDIVTWVDPNEWSGMYKVISIDELIQLEDVDWSESVYKPRFIEAYRREIQHVNRLFSVCHQHEYGSTHWLLKSPIFPNEDQVVETLNIDFEPEKDEFIDIEEIEEIHMLELS